MTKLPATIFPAAINVIAFAALFLAYTEGSAAERPQGVRRAMQTYAGQVATGAYPALEAIVQTGMRPGTVQIAAPPVYRTTAGTVARTTTSTKEIVR